LESSLGSQKPGFLLNFVDSISDWRQNPPAPRVFRPPPELPPALAVFKPLGKFVNGKSWMTLRQCQRPRNGAACFSI